MFDREAFKVERVCCHRITAPNPAMGVFALFLPIILGSAIIAQAQQCSKPLGGPNMQLKDDYITQETFPDGTTVSFRCDPGYTPAGGSARITCNAGEWSAVQLKCERKNCGALDEVPNGYIEFHDGTEFGDRAEIKCNRGYNLVGQSVLRCEDRGWSGRLPVCEVVNCLPPAEIVNGTFSPKNELYEYRAVVRYSCNNKALSFDGSSELVCGENGQFSPAPPKCVWVECKDPVIENSVFEMGSRPPHRHNATVTYSCKPGYKMDGQPTLMCNLNSQWSAPLPKCIKAPEPSRPPVTTTTTTTTTTTITTPKDHGEGLSSWIIILIVIAIVIFLIIIVVLYRKKRARRRSAVKEAPKDGEDVALS